MSGRTDAPVGDWLAYRIVDAFTDGPWSGNPAAVVLPSDPAPSRETRQAIAAELNLSETAFPSLPDAEGVRELRWFTPTTEVSLCGHATLATAHALLEEGAGSPLHFSSHSGPLTVHLEEDGRLRMDFPADPPNFGPPPPGLMEALGVLDESPWGAGARCGIVLLEDESAVRALTPDLAALRRVPLPMGMLGVSVTAPGDEVDFVSRFFGPWVGVDEDPVTGMAHCVLGPYWAVETARTTLEARQGLTRAGALTVRVEGDRVHLIGHATTVARGELRSAPPS